MLSREAINSAIPLATLLDEHGLTLQPVENSPLEALVKASRSDENFVYGSNGDYSIDYTTIEYMANKADENLGVASHDMVMDEVAAVGIKAVQEHLFFAKNVVAPTVDALVEKTNATLAELTPSSLLGMEVVVWNPPAPLLSSGFESLVRKFEEVSFDVPALAMNLPSLTVQEIIEQMKTGNGSVDKAVAEWAAVKGESFFIRVWENVFQLKQAELNETTAPTFRDFTEDRESGVEYALAIFLLARRLIDEPIPNTEMSLKSFTDLCTDYRNQTGARLCRALDELDQIKKSGAMVRTVVGSTITVNGNVYGPWIEQGGDNEVLFGLVVEGSLIGSVEAINTGAERLKAAWARHAAITAAVEANRRFGRVKDILYRHFSQMMREIVEGEEATVANRELVVKLFEEQLNNITESDIQDMYTLCLKLVCRSRFFRTDAEKILMGISEARRQNPNIDVREAAAISAVKYVSQWVASLFRVVAV